MNSEERKRMIQILEERLEDSRNYTKETIKANVAKAKEAEVKITVYKRSKETLAAEIENMVANEAGLQTEILELEDSASALTQQELDIEVRLANMPIRGAVDLVGRRNNTLEATLQDMRDREMVKQIEELEATREQIREQKRKERARLIQIRSELFERKQKEDELILIEAQVALAEDQHAELIDKTDPDTLPLDLVHDEIGRERFLSDVLKLDGQRGVDTWEDRIEAAKLSGESLLIYPPTMGPIEYTQLPPHVEAPVAGPITDPTTVLAGEAEQTETSPLSPEMMAEIERILSQPKQGPIFFDQDAPVEEPVLVSATPELAGGEPGPVFFDQDAPNSQPVRTAARPIEPGTEDDDLQPGSVYDVPEPQQASLWEKVKRSKWYIAAAAGVATILVLSTCVAPSLNKNDNTNTNTSRNTPKEAPFDPSQTTTDVAPAVSPEDAEAALTDTPAGEKAQDTGAPGNTTGTTTKGTTTGGGSGTKTGGTTNKGTIPPKSETVIIDDGDKKEEEKPPVDTTPPPYVPQPIPDPVLPPVPSTPEVQQPVPEQVPEAQPEEEAEQVEESSSWGDVRVLEPILEGEQTQGHSR